ncbi:helix-turn-helix domain-containing protein [Oceanobacillus neutriphilus]|uniref:HTH cro/C1-type domain-containing protein n=1 Tax=Oceanobacillus neutriphilus TaxID=531815 RepID=A0ABQ2NYJ5_9BACI|nr:hypothetical protein GCM10011346_33620 [Oceanobacillus neutriphilus]
MPNPVPTKPKRDGELPITYRPLRMLLDERKMKMSHLSKDLKIINTNTATKLLNDKPVSMDILVRLCHFLNVPIEQIIEILPPK